MPAKILVIDDEIDVLLMIQEHFSVRGYEVKATHNSEDGVQIAKDFEPDVILLDLKMKGKDGDQILPQLRNLSNQSLIYVVSAYQQEKIEDQLMSLGADAFFQKPISIKMLEDLVTGSGPRRCSKKDYPQ